MGIWENLKRVVKGNINDAISKAEDPQKILTQTIIDMNEQLIEAKKAVAGAIADEKKLERPLVENQYYPPIRRRWHRRFHHHSPPCLGGLRSCQKLWRRAG